MQLSKKEKIFLNFFLKFWNEDKILNILKKKLTLVANVFPKLRTPKNAVRKISKNCRFRLPFDKQNGKRAHTVIKSER